MQEYPNYHDVKLYLSITASNDDALLLGILKRAIKSFENLCGRTFLRETSTKKFSADGEEVVRWNHLIFRDDDAVLISQIKIDGEIVPSGDYYLTAGGVKLRTLSDFAFNQYSDDPRDSIEITGVWGYEEVPDDVFGAIVRLAAWFYQQKDNALELDRSVAMANGMALPAGFPKDVVEVARFYRRVM